MKSRSRMSWVVVPFLVALPTIVLAWGTLTGGLNLTATENDNLTWMLREYGLDPATLAAQYTARTGAHPIHQFIVQQASAVLAKDPALTDLTAGAKSGLPDVAAINAWDGVERCEQGMRERTPGGLVASAALAPQRKPGDTEAHPGADAELAATGGWNPTYNGRAHYWNPWTEDGDAPALAGINYERLAMLMLTGADSAKRAHHAAYLAHYISDPISAKHADIVTLDDATLDKLAKVAERWMAATQDEIENWIASPIVTEAVDLIEARARSLGPQGGAWLDRVQSHVGLIGGTKLLKRGWWVFSWIDIADSSFRSAVGCYLHELASRPTVGGVRKPDRFYSYFDPFYFNGPIYNPAFKAPEFNVCIPLSEHLFWETNPAQYELAKATLDVPGGDATILAAADPKSAYLPWNKKPDFASFDDAKSAKAMQETAADLVKRCSLLSHGSLGDTTDFAPPFKDKLTLAVRCVATALRASVTALRVEGWARRTPDGQMRAELVVENRADAPATLGSVRFGYIDAAGKWQTAPGWTSDLGGRAAAAGTPIEVGATIEGVPADIPVTKMLAEIRADFGTFPDLGMTRIALAARETRTVVNPGAATTLVRTKGPVDVIVVMDTTGSMQASIDSMRDNAIASIRRLREKTDDIRMAVVTFRDRAVESDRGAFYTQGFTKDLEAQFAFMRGLKADGGGDTPEDQLDGLSRAIALWENEPQDEDRVPAKIIVTITDAPAKVPDAAGNTFESIQARSIAVDPAHIYPIVIGSDSAAARDAARLAADTGGEVITVTTGNEVADALLKAVDTGVVVHGGEAPAAHGGRAVLVVGLSLIGAGIAVAVLAWVIGRRRRRAGADVTHEPPHEVTP